MLDEVMILTVVMQLLHPGEAPVRSGQAHPAQRFVQASPCTIDDRTVSPIDWLLLSAKG